MSDGKKINPFISIKENQIKDGSIISVNTIINIKFSGEYGSKIIALDENYPFKKAVKYFLLKIGKKGCYDKFSFIFEKKLNIEDKSPIKIIFRYLQIPSVQYYEKEFN